MSDHPDVVPLYPRRSPAEETANWRQVFGWIADNPPPGDWRKNPAARALLAAAEQFVTPTARRRGA